MKFLKDIFNAECGQNIGKSHRFALLFHKAIIMAGIIMISLLIKNDAKAAEGILSEYLSYEQARKLSKKEDAFVIFYGDDGDNTLYVRGMLKSFRSQKIKAIGALGGPKNGAVLFMQGRRANKLYTADELANGTLHDHVTAYHRMLAPVEGGLGR